MKNSAITPRGLHTHGKEFFYAAEAVFSSPKLYHLLLAFLWGRSIELLLKSYLLSKGETVEQLRSKKFGHNLVALYNAASAQGIDSLIGKDANVRGLMQVLNIEYCTKQLEYRESGARYHLPDATIARQVIQRLIRGVHRHLEQSGM